MKKILSCLAILILLSACAATSFKNVRDNANRVTNGMTVKEATAMLGMEPTSITSEKVQWRRGNAQFYDATRAGAVEFKLNNGVIAGVPPGGIFGSEARRIYIEARTAANEAESAANEAAAAAQRKREDLRNEENAKREALAKEEARKRRIAALQLEMKASESGTIICSDRVMCTKIFALVQIFVAQNADQKIQVATDTIIETYNPTEFGALGASITKTPQRGTTEVVKVVPSCKESESMGDLCIRRRTDFYNKLRLFIAENLKK